MSKLHLKYYNSVLKGDIFPIGKTFTLSNEFNEYEIAYDRLDDPEESYGSVMLDWKDREIQEYKITFLTLHGLFLLCQ